MVCCNNNKRNKKRVALNPISAIIYKIFTNEGRAMESFRERERGWLLDNPLKKWRVANGFMIRDIAAAAGWGYHTAYRWEIGQSTPNDDQVKALIKITGNKNIKQELMAWAKRRPLVTDVLEKGG